MNRREFIGGSMLGAVALASGGAGAAMLRSEPKAVLDAKRAALEGLRELGPTITDFTLCRKRDIPGRCAAFYIDDVIWIFRDLAATKPKSCWDHRFLGHLKEAHERYGLKVQLNVFYRDDFYYGVKASQFSLRDMPDAWKDEFQSAKDWLKFGFHSLQEFPDYPWISASYEDTKLCWEMIAGEVERFAGPGMFGRAVTPHWGSSSREACLAFRDCGAKAVSTSRGRRWAYDGNRAILPYGHAMRIENHRQPESAVYWRAGSGDDIAVSVAGYNHLDAEQVDKTRGTWNWIRDNATGLNFKAYCVEGTLLNLLPLEDIPAAFARHGEPEFYCYATHEEYFYHDYFAYQQDYAEKTLAAAKWMYNHGYDYVFVEDSFD